MSLSSLIRKAAKTAVVSLGDLASSKTVSSRVSFTINAETETLTPSATSTNVRMVTYGFRETEVDGDRILRSDLRAVVHVEDMPNGMVFSTNDTVTINSIVYNLKDYRLDPTGSVWFLHLRAS